MKDIITISVVNFDPVWGDSSDNTKRIAEYVEAAGKQGVDMIVFPESALTGYDDDAGKALEEKMHRRLAETVPGSSSNMIAEITKKYGMYAIYGMPERDTKDTSKVYNSAAICGPDGVVGTYRKVHLPPFNEFWAVRGTEPGLIDTPWGPVGIGVCCDTYAFPELMRYCRGMGARLFINCTAIGTAESGGAGGYTGNLSLEYLAHTNDMYIASANMFGKDLSTFFMGGSSIIGPASKPPHIHYYAGHKFLEPGADEGTVATATIDLSYVKRSFINAIWEPVGDVPYFDWRPELYAEWFQRVVDNGLFARPEK